MIVLSPKQMIALRKKAGLTQREVTTKCNVSDTALSRIERGYVAEPFQRTLDRLAKAYGCKVEDFYVEATTELSTNADSAIFHHLQAIKKILAGEAGSIEEYRIEIKLSGANYNSITHTRDRRNR